MTVITVILSVAGTVLVYESAKALIAKMRKRRVRKRSPRIYTSAIGTLTQEEVDELEEGKWRG